jgi:hypothetical protein
VTSRTAARPAALTGVAIWARWVVANAASEAIGLGATALLGWQMIQLAGASTSAAIALLSAGTLVLAGALIEGGAVGTAQWVVLRQVLPGLSWRQWAGATGLGAAIAWTLGMLPSTLFSLAADPAAAPTAEPDAWVTLTLAAALGLAAGVILALPQWGVLRQIVHGAAWWLLVNAIAWAVGMPLVFALVDVVVARGMSPLTAVLAVGWLAGVGAVVGAIHGTALVALTRPERQLPPKGRRSLVPPHLLEKGFADRR